LNNSSQTNCIIQLGVCSVSSPDLGTLQLGTSNKETWCTDKISSIILKSQLSVF